MTDSIQGFWVATATPLDAAGNVDHAHFVRHAQWLFDQGADGIVPFGTTGEGTSFSAAERLDAIQALLAAGIDPARISLGTGCPAITDSVALTKGALALGLHHVLILPPYFYRDADAHGIEDAFAAILDGVNDDRLRATLYHIPQVSGVPVPPAALANLRARYGRIVAGVKDSSADFAQFQAFRAAAPDVSVTIGNEADIARALAEGGAGTICGMANIAPAQVAALFKSPEAAGPMKQAIALMSGPFCPALKSALAALTGEASWSRVRAPLRPAPTTIGTAIADGLRALSLPKAA